MTNALTQHPPDLLGVLQQAIDKGVSADTLDKLLGMVERLEDRRAAQQFGAALANFQTHCPMVPKSRIVSNRDKTTRYKFAGLEDVMAVAGPHLAGNGISVSFSTPKEDADEFVMNCRLQVGSHFEDRPFRGPKPDLKALAESMHLTTPQAYGLVLSYYKRYALCAAAGITVCDEDNDAAAPPATLDPEEQSKVLDLIEKTDSDPDRFLAWVREAAGDAEIDCVADIPKRLLKLIFTTLRKKKEAPR